MTKPFLSLTEVAQMATDRVEQVMHLPPDGESRHTPSPEQSYGPRALGEAGGLPAVSGLGAEAGIGSAPGAGAGLAGTAPAVSQRLTRARDYSTAALTLVSLAHTELSVLNMNPLEFASGYSGRDLHWIADDIARLVRLIESDLQLIESDLREMAQ